MQYRINLPNTKVSKDVLNCISLHIVPNSMICSDSLQSPQPYHCWPLVNFLVLNYHLLLGCIFKFTIYIYWILLSLSLSLSLSCIMSQRLNVCITDDRKIESLDHLDSSYWKCWNQLLPPKLSPSVHVTSCTNDCLCLVPVLLLLPFSYYQSINQVFVYRTPLCKTVKSCAFQ